MILLKDSFVAGKNQKKNGGVNMNEHFSVNLYYLHKIDELKEEIRKLKEENEELKRKNEEQK